MFRSFSGLLALAVLPWIAPAAAEEFSREFARRFARFLETGEEH